MYNNLVNEIVKKGYKTEEIAHILANLLNCSEEIIENKLKHVGEFTFQEVIKIRLCHNKWLILTRNSV